MSFNYGQPNRKHSIQVQTPGSCLQTIATPTSKLSTKLCMAIEAHPRHCDNKSHVVIVHNDRWAAKDHRWALEAKPGVTNDMRRLIRHATLLILTLGLLSTGAQALPLSRAPGPAIAPRRSSSALSPEDRVDVFEEVWETVNEKYYDASFNGVDWLAVRERYRPLVKQALSDDDFYDLLKRMVGELRDAHTRFHTPEQRRERERRQAVSIGVSIFDVEGKPVVVSVEPDSDARRAGVEPGMILLTIDGKPLAERLAEARARVAGTSSDRAIQLRVYRMIIDGDPGTTVRMSLARPDASVFEVSLSRRIVSDDPMVTSRRLQSGAGYIRLTLWKSPIRKSFKKALEQFKDAPGVVIDLRGNPGGEAGEVVNIASFFFDAHVSFGKFSKRSGKAISLRTDDDHRVYKGPVAILVNEGSGSGSELFAGVMQENGRASVVGRQSCGCMLGISEFKKVKGGGELAVSEYGYLSPRENSFEGSGVIPDVAVALKISDLQNHRDAALDEAERFLKTKPETRTSLYRDVSTIPALRSAHLNLWPRAGLALDRLTRLAISR
jgi:carboxyl-terminal processing protease